MTLKEENEQLKQQLQFANNRLDAIDKQEEARWGKVVKEVVGNIRIRHIVEFDFGDIDLVLTSMKLFVGVMIGFTIGMMVFQ